MSEKFGRTLLGYKPGEVENKIEQIKTDYAEKIALLETEIKKTKVELDDAEKRQVQLEAELREYTEKEKMITEVMIRAQTNAKRIEEDAHEKARMMLQKSEEELNEKLKELEFLRMKVKKFKEEFRETLDNYRVSLENVKEIPEDSAFTPTLVAKEKTLGKG